MGKCKFLESWLSQDDPNGNKCSEWLRKVPDNAEKGFCFVCNKSFSVAKGIQTVKQHAEGSNHISNKYYY